MDPPPPPRSPVPSPPTIDVPARRRRRVRPVRPPAITGARGHAHHPGERQVLDVRLIDLRERAVALAGVVAVVGGPESLSGLSRSAGVTPPPCAAGAGRRQQERAASSSFVNFISGSPGTRSRRACLCRCTRASRSRCAFSGSWTSTFGTSPFAAEGALRSVGQLAR